MMDNTTGKGLSFAKRIYLPRIIGKGFGLIVVAAAITPMALPTWTWMLLLFNGLVWPHVAYQWSRRSSTPYQAERCNLLIDSLMAGFWTATMHFNPLPSLTVLSMVTMNNVAAGGKPLLLQGVLAQASGALLAMAVLGAGLQLDVTSLQVYACLPMLSLYPLALGWVCYDLAIKLSEHKRRLDTLSRTDSLTGLLNHGAWQDHLQLRFAACRQRQESAVIALIDIDHFKTINDTYGHGTGDMVLRQLSQELKRSVREGDKAGRYGGDEFCVILRQASEAQAYLVMERLRERVASYRDARLPELRIRLSIGLSGYDPDLSGPETWLENADKALYVAKRQGRDQVNLSQTPAVPLRLVHSD